MNVTTKGSHVISVCPHCDTLLFGKSLAELNEVIRIHFEFNEACQKEQDALPSLKDLIGILATDNPPVRYDHTCDRCGEPFSNVIRDCQYCCVCQSKVAWE